MYLLDALESIKQHPKGPFVSSEFEVFALVQLTGWLDLETVHLKSWEFLERDDDTGVRSVYLRTRSFDAPGPSEPSSVPTQGEQYYFPGGLASEVVALLSLLTRS